MPEQSNASDQQLPNEATTQIKRCVPCESLDRSTLLEEDAIQNEVTSSIPLWSIKRVVESSTNDDDDDGDNDSTMLKISRSFTAKNFQAAMNAITEIGTIAERENHHPDLHLKSYRNVEIVLYTHSVGGVTKNDILLAKMIDEELKVLYSPKWLREHPEAKGTSKVTE